MNSLHYLTAVCLLLVRGTFCLGVSAPVENFFDLMNKGRQAFRIGDYEEAERHHLAAVELAKESGRASEYGEALGDLGGVYIATARYDESRRVCMMALTILRNTTPNRYLAVVLNNLGVLTTQSREFETSESYFKDSLHVVQSQNRHDPFSARIFNNLGFLYYTAGNTDAAEKSFKNAIAIIERELGRDRDELAPILSNLAGLYIARNKLKEAEPLLNRALLQLQKSVGHTHPDFAGVLENVGLMHYARRNYGEAQIYFRNAFAIRLNVFGAKHPSVARSGSGLAAALIAGGSYSEAEKLLNDALAIYDIRGVRSIGVAETLETLARLLGKTDREAEAEMLEARAEILRFELDHTIRADLLRN